MIKEDIPFTAAQGDWNVLFDIDGTLTDDLDAPQIDGRFLLGNALFEVFRTALVEQGFTPARAAQALQEHVDHNVFWDYADFIVAFDLPPRETWDRLRAWHRAHIRVFEDGVALVRELASRGLPLHIISNNPLTGCLLKLEVAGLGSLAGSPWFERVFCSNVHRGQKGQSNYWRRALVSAGLDPETTIVVGNDVHEDGDVPASVGFAAQFIIDRNGVLPRTASGPVIVRSLMDVPGHPAFERLFSGKVSA